MDTVDKPPATSWLTQQWTSTLVLNHQSTISHSADILVYYQPSIDTTPDGKHDPGFKMPAGWWWAFNLLV